MPILQRTPPETVDRMREIEANHCDLHGLERSQLMNSLPWANVQQFLRADHPWNEEKWNAQRLTAREDVEAKILDFLPYAWGKANACDGISVLRSASYFMGLLWLLGREQDALREAMKPDDEPQTVKIGGENVVDLRPKFDYFGKPGLVALSQAFGFDWRGIDDKKWRNSVDEEPITAAEALQS